MLVAGRRGGKEGGRDLVRERDALRLLGDVGRWVEVVPVDEGEGEGLREGETDGGLAAAAK